MPVAVTEFRVVADHGHVQKMSFTEFETESVIGFGRGGECLFVICAERLETNLQRFFTNAFLSPVREKLVLFVLLEKDWNKRNFF